MEFSIGADVPKEVLGENFKGQILLADGRLLLYYRPQSTKGKESKSV
jgi:hypothetical protein